MPLARRLSVIVLIVLSILVVNLNSAQAQVSVITYHNDNARTGQNLNETILTPLNVNRSSFGQLFNLPVDGYVYGQPLYLPHVSIGGSSHNVVYVVTENDSVYAFDADTSQAPLWQVSLINPAAGITTIPTASVGPNATDIGPGIGITSTPVIDPSSGTLYLVASTEENGAYVQRLHALDVTTGAEKLGGPVQITASVPGTAEDAVNGEIVFNPLLENQRAALLLSNGVVYIAWASFHDTEPYHGWVMAYSASTLTQLAAMVTTPNGSEGGIWQSGGGLAADAGGNVFLADGNGTFDANTSGGDYGECILRLNLTSSNSLVVGDYFAPYNYEALNEADRDLGSGGPVLLPTQSGGYPDLLIHAGKQGTLYLVNRNSLGGFSASGDNVVQEIVGALNPIFGDPAYFNNNVYFWGSSDEPKMLSLANGVLSSTWTARASTSDYSSFPGATMTVSASGTNDGIIWAVQTDGSSSGGPAILRAFNPADLSEIYNTNMDATRDTPGPAVKFVVPTVANGKVYVGTQTEISVYGLLNGAGPAVTLSPDSLNFNNQSVNQASPAETITLSYMGTGSLTISNISATGNFAETNNCSSPLAAGGQCTITVTFTPITSGALTGTLSVADADSTGSGTQALSLYGTGVTSAGAVISISPPSLAFGYVTPGTTSNLLTVGVSNAGTGYLEISALRITAPFEMIYYPTTPLTLTPGETTQISLAFAPPNSAAFDGTFTVTSNATSGNGTVALSGTGGSAPNIQISVSPTGLTFGSQTVNTTSSPQVITVSNASSSGSLTVTGFGVPAPFTLASAPSVPFTLAAGQSAQATVAFSPTATGAFSGAFTVNSNATTGPSAVPLSGTGASSGPSVTLSPASLTFGNQTVGQPSVAQTVTLTNTGSSALTVASITASGNFADTHNCTTLAANTQCAISVTFTPSVAGALTGAVTITDSNSTGSAAQTAGLSGTGVAASGASIAISPSTLAFGTEATGAVSSYQTVTVTNTSSVNYLTINGLSIPAPFELIYYPATPITLGPGELTHVTMAFAPTTSGTFNGTFTVASDATSGSGTVALSGTTSGSSVEVSVSPSSLSFASQTVNTTSASATVAITNSGSSGTLTVSALNIAAPFAIISAPALPFILTAGQSTGVAVTFSPTTTGSFSGTLTVTSNATSGANTVGLSGTGAAAASSQISISPASLNFGSEAVGGSSGYQSVAITNTSSSAYLTITGLSISAPFELIYYPATPVTLGPGETTHVIMDFDPTATGTFTGALTVNNSSSTGPATVMLGGTGQ